MLLVLCEFKGSLNFLDRRNHGIVNLESFEKGQIRKNYFF